MRIFVRLRFVIHFPYASFLFVWYVFMVAITFMGAWTESQSALYPEPCKINNAVEKKGVYFYYIW